MSFSTDSSTLYILIWRKDNSVDGILDEDEDDDDDNNDDDDDDNDDDDNDNDDND